VHCVRAYVRVYVCVVCVCLFVCAQVMYIVYAYVWLFNVNQLSLLLSFYPLAVVQISMRALQVSIQTFGRNEFVTDVHWQHERT
jgi:hypothetical protein